MSRLVLVKMLAVAAGLASALAGCQETYVEGEEEKAVVIGARCEPRGGQADCKTVVRFPDMSVRSRVGWWGNPGDTILAIRASDLHGWLSPRSP